MRTALIIEMLFAFVCAAIGSMASAQSSQANTAYPAGAYSENREGIVGVKVIVNEEGRAESCSVTRSSGWQDLDDAACASMKTRALLRPAYENGKPVKSTYSTTIVYRMTP